MGWNAIRELQKRPKELLIQFRPFGDLDKIVTPREHPTEAQDDNVDQRVFEILALAAGIANRLQPLHQGTRHHRHEHSCSLQNNRAALSILTPSFYKDRSAFTVRVSFDAGTFSAVLRVRNLIDGPAW